MNIVITSAGSAPVTSRIDYCNGLLANAPSIWTDKLQRVLNAAAPVITNTRKFDRGLTSILHDDLHWLDLPRRVLFKICVTVYKSLHGMAPISIWRSCAGPSPTSRGASPPLWSAWTSAHTSLLPFNVRKTSLFLCRSICLEFSSRSCGQLSFRHLLKTFLFTQMTHAAH